MSSDVTLRDVLDGARGYLLVGGIAVVFAVIFVVVELLSPDHVIWTGRCVPAYFDGGQAHYKVAGQPFVTDNPPLTDRTPGTISVCYYPSDPGNGYIVHPAAYWVEGSLVVGPLGVALILVAVGTLRSARRLGKPTRLPPLSRFGAH